MTKPAPNCAAGLSPGRGHNHAPGPQAQDVVDAFTEILLGERSSDTPNFLDSIMSKAELSQYNNPAAPDVLLTDLLLFPEDRQIGYNNLFCADNGLLTEKLITTLFAMARGETIDASEASMKSLELEYHALKARWERRRSGKKGKKPEKFPEWKKADFLMGTSCIVECKYRFNSYDGKQKQIKIARIYRELGLKPIFLHLSPDYRHRADFEANGWEVYTGEEMIEYINDHTGFDFRDLLRRVSAQPVVRQRILHAHDEMLERQKAELRRDYLFAPEEVKEDFLDAFAADKWSLARLSNRIPPGDPALTGQRLRDHAEQVADQTAKTLSQEKFDLLVSAVKSLEESQRSELISIALQHSSRETQLAAMSVFG